MTPRINLTAKSIQYGIKKFSTILLKINSELKLAIDSLNQLFNERDSPEWWSQNIIEASKHLKKKEDWTVVILFIFKRNIKLFYKNVMLWNTSAHK